MPRHALGLISGSRELTSPVVASAVLFCILVAAASTPAFANVTPEAIVYFNVRPLGDPALYCTTAITGCEQMQNSTPLLGPVEFQIFIDPLVNQHGDIPVTNFTADLTWPDGWQLLDAAYCRGGSGTIHSGGSSPHRLVVDWDCTPMTGMFLAADLVLNVTGHGYLTINGPVSVWLGCPPEGAAVVPITRVAEAGTDCEYTNNPCGGGICVASFYQDELTLTTTPGGTAHGEMEFTASYGFPPHEYGCHGAFQTRTGETWLSAHVEDGVEFYQNRLILDADATGLGPGQYQTWVQVSSAAAARCVTINLVVQDGTPIRRLTWGCVKSLYR